MRAPFHCSAVSTSAGLRKGPMSMKTSAWQGAGRLKVKIWDNHETMSRAAAAFVARELGRNPRLLLCLSAGASPARAYDLLAARARKFPALFHQLRIVKLDEWDG